MSSTPNKADYLAFDSFHNRICLKGRLRTLTALRIGAGRATGVTETDLPIVRNAIGHPYIPGSSFKGAMRASLESILRSVSKDKRIVCNPLIKEQSCLSQAERMKDEEVFEKTCMVCRVFGSPWLASKVSIRDLSINQELWFDQHEIRNGVAIDRDTGAASEGKLYDFEVVPAGTEFFCEIVAENAEEWELGLLMLGLRPFEQGEAVLGGARSRGLGAVQIDWDKRTRIKAADLLDYLAGDSSPASFTDEDAKGWVHSFRSELEMKLEGNANA